MSQLRRRRSGAKPKRCGLCKPWKRRGNGNAADLQAGRLKAKDATRWRGMALAIREGEA